MTTIEALKIIEPADNSIGALKKAYHEKAMRYHPDRQNGNEEYMKLVNMAYEVLLNAIGKYNVSETKDSDELPLTEQLAKIYDKIKYFSNITIEVAGTWFWITGNTYTYRAELKNMGFKWANKKKAWYFHEGEYKKETRRNWDLNEIRDKFSAFTLENSISQSLGNA